MSYLSNFRRLVAETNWPEQKRCSLFYRGLNDDLKDALAQIVDPPEDWEELIDLVVKIDHRLGERRGEKSKVPKLFIFKSDKKSTDPKVQDDVEPMQIGGIWGPLSKEEKDRRRKFNFCLYCGKSGHYAKDCLVRPKLKKVAATTQPQEDLDQEN